MSSAKLQGLLDQLIFLNDWDLLSVVQQALCERNARNREEFARRPIEDAAIAARFKPSQYAVGTFDPRQPVAKERYENLYALAMHTFGHLDEYTKFLDVEDSWLESRMVLSCSFHEGGGCDGCGIELHAAGKIACCPICGKPVSLT